MDAKHGTKLKSSQDKTEDECYLIQHVLVKTEVVNNGVCPMK